FGMAWRIGVAGRCRETRVDYWGGFVLRRCGPACEPAFEPALQRIAKAHQRIAARLLPDPMDQQHTEFILVGSEIAGIHPRARTQVGMDQGRAAKSRASMDHSTKSSLKEQWFTLARTRPNVCAQRSDRRRARDATPGRTPRLRADAGRRTP